MRTILLFSIYLFALLAPAVAEQATKDSLVATLQTASPGKQRLETLTNLMDIYRKDEHLKYAKDLYAEALKEDDAEYKEIALTEILRHYVNTDVNDSVRVYMAEAEKQLDKKTATYLNTFIQTYIDVRIAYYKEGEERAKLVEDYMVRLKTEKNLSDLEKASINYVLAMAYTHVREREAKYDEEYIKQQKEYFKATIEAVSHEPIERQILFGPNAYYTYCLYAEPYERAQYAREYLAMLNKYNETEGMKKRPYAPKRHLLNALTMLAQSPEIIGKDLATSYYNQFTELLKKYPDDASFSPEYEYYNTSANYYNGIKDFKKAIEMEDSLIPLLRRLNYGQYVLAFMKDKINLCDSAGLYKEAYHTYKEYEALLDTVHQQAMKQRVEDLGIQKNVEQLIIEKKELELQVEKKKMLAYCFLSLFILALCAAFYVIFRLDKMQHLYKELQESNRKVIIASEKAQESEKMKNAFIQNMCHEIRTPLNAINGFAELITAEDVPADEKQEYSKVIYENCSMLTSMVTSMLEIAQLDSDSQSFPLAPVHLFQVCEQEMKNLMHFHGKDGIDYCVEGVHQNDLIITSDMYLRMLLSHLLHNANKFTESGSIELAYKLKENEKKIVITVTDTGIGIPRDKQEWVFERFAKTNDFIPGTGLGLYLCRIIATRLNGKIWIDPEYTSGARFVVELPLEKASDSPVL